MKMPLIVQAVIRAQNAFFKGCRGLDDFERRPRLIVPGHGKIFIIVLRIALKLIGVVIRIIGHCQNFAAMRVHHDDCGMAGALVTERNFQFPFNHILDILINGQHQTIAGVFDIQLPTVQRITPGIHRHGKFLGMSLQVMIVIIFQSLQSVIIVALLIQAGES